MKSVHPEIEEVLKIINLRMCKEHTNKALTIEHLKEAHGFVRWDSMETFLSPKKDNKFHPVINRLGDLKGEKRFEKRVGKVG